MAKPKKKDSSFGQIQKFEKPKQTKSPRTKPGGRRPPKPSRGQGRP